MHLIMCKDCLDIVNMSLELRSCFCGKVKGRLSNQRSTEITAKGEFVVLKIDNQSLMQSILLQKEETPVPFVSHVMGKEFDEVHVVEEIK